MRTPLSKVDSVEYTLEKLVKARKTSISWRAGVAPEYVQT
jgi:hypothetical protein